MKIKHLLKAGLLIAGLAFGATAVTETNTVEASTTSYYDVVTTGSETYMNIPELKHIKIDFQVSEDGTKYRMKSNIDDKLAKKLSIAINDIDITLKYNQRTYLYAKVNKEMIGDYEDGSLVKAYVNLNGKKLPARVRTWQDGGLTITSNKMQDIEFEKVSKNYTRHIDIQPGHYAWEPVYELKQKGIIDMPENGKYNPNAELTRGQVAGMLSRATEALILRKTNKNYFNDLKGRWYAEDVNALVELGIINPNQKNYNGQGKMTRQQAAVMLARLGGMTSYNYTRNIPNYTDYNKISEEGKIAVERLYSISALAGTGAFNPQGNITRAQFAKMLHLVERYCNTYGCSYNK